MYVFFYMRRCQAAMLSPSPLLLYGVDLTPGIRPCHPEYALHKQFCVCTFDLWLSAAFAFCLFPFPLIYTRMHAHHNFGTTATAPYSRNTGS